MIHGMFNVLLLYYIMLDHGIPKPFFCNKLLRSYIYTVGIEDAYRKKLERAFEGKGITFIVEKKADAKYASCSAASVVAKESRDTIIRNWKWTEGLNYEPKQSHEFGSGYVSSL